MYYDIKETGKRIQALRKLNGYTQEQLAEDIGISMEQQSKVERGQRGYSVDTLVCVSQLFDVSLDYLILGKEHNNLPSKQEIQYLIDKLTQLKEGL